MACHGFDEQLWKALPDQDKVKLRKLYTKIHYRASKQMAKLLRAVKRLRLLDEEVLKETQSIMGGEPNVRQLFGAFENPLGLDEETVVEDGDIVRAVSFEDLEEILKERCDELGGFNGVDLCYLQQEPEAS